MRAFFQELKTNGRRRTAPQRGGRRPIRFRRQAPALGRPHGIDHIRAPSTPTRGLAALFALPRPTAHHGRRPSGTRHPNPRPRTNQQQRPRPHANKDLRPQHRPHTGPDRPHTPPSQRLHHTPPDIRHDGAAREPELNRSRRARQAAAGPHSLHVLVAGAGNGVANPGHQHRTRYGLRRRRTRPAPARARRSRRWRRRCCCGCSRRRRRRRPGPARRR